MKYQSTTPIFWFCRQLRGFSCFCKDVIHMHRLNMNMRLTQECHQDIRSFVRHLSKGYTSSNNRGGYKFRRATYLIWEPALFFFFRYEWQKAIDNYSCSGSIRPLQWKTIGTQVYKKNTKPPPQFFHVVHTARGSQLLPKPMESQRHWCCCAPLRLRCFCSLPHERNKDFKNIFACACPRG